MKQCKRVAEDCHFMLKNSSYQAASLAEYEQ